MFENSVPSVVAETGQWASLFTVAAILVTLRYLKRLDGPEIADSAIPDDVA